MLQAHDPTQFEVFCYADNAKSDEVTAKFRQAVQQWRVITGFTDAAAADLIRRDHIDVLVDQTGHMSRNRMLVLARKPASIQILYPGYPNTTGTKAVGYCITDSQRAAEGADVYYTEQLIRLQGTSQCYLPAEDDPEVGPCPYLRNGYITFGSLGKAAKITPLMTHCWAEILTAIPSARLLLMNASDGSYAAEYRRRFATAGGDASRLEFTSTGSRKAYMELYNRIDIALDTFPYNGHTTTLDTLWMGVPVITVAGDSHVAREGSAALRSVGLPGLVAETPYRYVELAEQLESDRNQLSLWRSELRNCVRASWLSNSAQLTGSIENAVRTFFQ